MSEVCRFIIHAESSDANNDTPGLSRQSGTRVCLVVVLPAFQIRKYTQIPSGKRVMGASFFERFSPGPSGILIKKDGSFLRPVCMLREMLSNGTSCDIDSRTILLDANDTSLTFIYV